MKVKRKAGRKSTSIYIDGVKLKELLKERDMRQQDLAESIIVMGQKGVSLSTINRAINHNSMETSVLIAVADYFGISPDYLTGDKKIIEMPKSNFIREAWGIAGINEAVLHDINKGKLSDYKYKQISLFQEWINSISDNYQLSDFDKQTAIKIYSIIEEYATDTFQQFSKKK